VDEVLLKKKFDLRESNAHVEVCHLNGTQDDKEPIRFIPPEPDTS
jgi:hypothetical protein